MFDSNNTRQAWSYLKTISDFKKKSNSFEPDNKEEFPNELNDFYSRFDIHNFNNELNELVDLLKERNDPEIKVTSEDVKNVLKRINIRKATGPDNICGRVLKLCSEQLKSILSKLFQSSINQHIVPVSWKTASIVPVPKSSLPKCKNDLRPVALTPVIMKTCERVVLSKLLPQISPHMDPFQFAYTEGLGVDDAVLTLLHTLHQHLDNLKTSARLLFVDFSSAFNTIQPHLLMEKLMDMGVNSHLILWIKSFLTNRKQYVIFNGNKSDVIEINTGAPQGCVLSAVLFIVYTADCRSLSNHVIVKYADDTVIVGLISNKDDENDYVSEVDRFVNWCDQNFLNLNVKKTKEMIVNFSKSPQATDPIEIKGSNVDTVDEYKYLGNIIDSKLKGNLNVSRMYKKCNQRLYFLRKLKNVNVDSTILTLFYKSIIQSVLTFCITSWFGNATATDTNKLDKIVKCAKRLGCITISDLDLLYELAVRSKINKIISNERHPLNKFFCLLPSGSRMNVMYARTNRFKSSFVPKAIKIYNEH